MSEYRGPERRGDRSVYERMATLEANHQSLEHEFREAHRLSVEERKELRVSIDSIGTRLDRQLTFVGGIIFTISALWAVILFAKDWFLAHLRP